MRLPYLLRSRSKSARDFMILRKNLSSRVEKTTVCVLRSQTRRRQSLTFTFQGKVRVVLKWKWKSLRLITKEFSTCSARPMNIKI